jgi:hypothetical protein
VERPAHRIEVLVPESERFARARAGIGEGEIEHGITGRAPAHHRAEEGRQVLARQRPDVLGALRLRHPIRPLAALLLQHPRRILTNDPVPDRIPEQHGEGGPDQAHGVGHECLPLHRQQLADVAPVNVADAERPESRRDVPGEQLAVAVERARFDGRRLLRLPLRPPLLERGVAVRGGSRLRLARLDPLLGQPFFRLPFRAETSANARAGAIENVGLKDNPAGHLALANLHERPFRDRCVTSFATNRTSLAIRSLIGTILVSQRHTVTR